MFNAINTAICHMRGREANNCNGIVLESELIGKFEVLMDTLWKKIIIYSVNQILDILWKEVIVNYLFTSQDCPLTTQKLQSDL